MEAILLYILIAVVTALLVYFMMKSSHVPRQQWEETRNLLSKSEAETLATKHLIDQALDRQKALERDLATVTQSKEQLLMERAELETLNKNLEDTLEQHKLEVLRLQEQAKEQFENLANKILEEKSHKFTHANQENLKRILEPFQEKINELKNRVNEAYDMESKQRFTLGEKVKELALLNQQISEDAQKLTRALKGDSKTQGSWGEMILASILEKSGLEKGREYFLEHQLMDENNKAIYSEFSGKKMRPDAVIKYPDNRTVIIDSKVSLTAFVDMCEEPDSDIQAIKKKQHLDSIKRHIDQLSTKAYDDYRQSLDFVILFVPNEAAYIAAMQGDSNLWNYAYDKRIILLNPSNLITSLRLIADLWRRDKQTKNVLEIADRGGKLYDKFVGFVEDMDRIQNAIQASQKAYTEAYSKLTSGRGNLVSQAQSLKTLGIKTKKELSSSMVEDANDLELQNPFPFIGEVE